MKEEVLVRIIFETHQQVISAEELTARKQLNDTMEQAIQSFHAEFPKTDVVEIEMYPCNCAECEAAQFDTRAGASLTDTTFRVQ